jgi:6-phospho-3-hexuloisomerase
MEAVLKEDRHLLREVPDKAIEDFIEGLDRTNRVFCAAQGRSGYILRCFCMRLMHLGFKAFFVGETITPGITAGDILVVCSGSGHTPLTHEWVRLAKAQGAVTYGIIGMEDSPIGRTLDHSVCLPGGSKKDPPRGFQSAQPPGSLFEQAAFVLLETIVLALYQRGDEGALFHHHANLE